MELQNIIRELLDTGVEGSYWDFKSDYAETNEEKLHDIICMANNLENRDAYLIYGADNDGSICGIENTAKTRITSKSIIEFLRSKKFAGGYIPNVKVECLHMQGHELDVLIIYRSDKTPYYLTEDYKDRKGNKKIVKAGVVYTRTENINTPMLQVASIEATEYLWRKRFGYDMRPMDRFLLLLRDFDNWTEADWDSCLRSYHTGYPEFQIVAEKHDHESRGFDHLSFFYDDPTMFYAPLKLMYYSTVLYETELWYMDCGRCILPKPEIASLGFGKYRYYYFVKNTNCGRLIEWFTKGKYCCNDRSGLKIPVMFFETEAEHIDFEQYFDGNKEQIGSVVKEVNSHAVFQHKMDVEMHELKGKPSCGVMEIAVTYEMFKRWEESQDKKRR